MASEKKSEPKPAEPKPIKRTSIPPKDGGMAFDHQPKKK